MAYQTIEVRKLTPTIGAEIFGVDLAQPLGNQQFQEVHDALMDNLVVFFRDQKLTPDQQIAFSKRFGEIHHHPFVKGMEEYPDILEIIKEESDTRAFGSTWHTDQMFNPKPAKATILYAKETPDAGGDTGNGDETIPTVRKWRLLKWLPGGRSGASSVAEGSDG